MTGHNKIKTTNATKERIVEVLIWIAIVVVSFFNLAVLLLMVIA